MSGWPWMKGAKLAVAPVPPVCPEDDRKSVKDLIDEHREKIDLIRAELKDEPLFDGFDKHDDLWLLRFYLSHKKTDAAVAAAKHTLAFREKHKLDEKDIRPYAPHHIKEGMVATYWDKRCQGDAIVCALPDDKRGIVMFLQFARFDPKAVDTLDEETWDYAFIYTSEWCHQWLDYVTRTTGRLTKSARFIDMTGVSMTKHMSRASSKRDAKIMNEMEDCYPQLLEKIFIVNAPEFMHLIWEFFRPIMPSRITSKIDVIAPKTNEKERKRLYQYLSDKHLPDDMGGQNSVPPVKWESCIFEKKKEKKDTEEEIWS